MVELSAIQITEGESAPFNLAQLAQMIEYHSSVFVKLEPEDASFLRSKLHFPVVLPLQDGLHQVEPGPQVCRAVLPCSGAEVMVRPKLDIRNVFDMLGVAYGLYTERHPHAFDVGSDVGYNIAPDLFETLVRHFLDLIEEKLRFGLMADYIVCEENLSTIRGRIAFEHHIENNLVRRDRIFCRFSEFLRDIPENQVLLWALFSLSRVGFWTDETRQRTFAAVRQFHGVSLTPFRKGGFPVFHYHRLNDGYRELHRWAKLFVDAAAFSDKPGDFTFRGFVLNMNELFEDFVTQAFLNDAGDFEIEPQRTHRLFDKRTDTIKPDIFILRNGMPVAVVDAKYKRTKEEEFKNFDVYQVISYATAIGIDRAFLLYPDIECDHAWEGNVLNSPIRVAVKTVSLSQPGVSMRDQAQTLAKKVLNELTVEAALR